MTHVDRAWETETLELLSDARRDRAKAERRLNNAQHTLKIIDEKISGLRIALEAYRFKHGIPRDDDDTVDPRLAAEYQGKTLKEMVDRWATTHGGSVYVRDMGRTLAGLGLFTNDNQAFHSLYSTAKRMDADFQLVARGIFQRVERAPEAVGDVASARPTIVHLHPTTRPPRPTASIVPTELEDLEDLPF